jgi:hypothetical protein
MHDTDIADAEISDGDEQRYDAGVRACRLHLADLVRVHGPHPEPRPKGRRKGKGKGAVGASCVALSKAYAASALALSGTSVTCRFNACNNAAMVSNRG